MNTPASGARQAPDDTDGTPDAPSRVRARSGAVLAARAAATLTTTCALLAGTAWLGQPAAVLHSRPGAVHDISGRAVTGGAQLNGKVLLPTIEVDQVSRWRHVIAMATGKDGEFILNDRSSATSGTASGAQQMFDAEQTAQRIATSWAADAAGTRPVDADGARVDHVLPDSAAARAGLQAADLIIALRTAGQRHRVTGSAELVRLLQQHGNVELHLERDGRSRVARIARSTNSSRADGHTGPAANVGGDSESRAEVTLDAEFGWKLRAGYRTTNNPSALRSVEGSSGGLALTIAYYDARSEGDLLAGHLVSGTGTIDRTGTISVVQGVQDKAAAARAAGAEVFFVPAAQAALLRTPPDGLLVVPVDTLDDVVAWLCRHGGSSPRCGYIGMKS